ncbi:hypothetical protein MOE48_17530 [Bacillus inaquosorum]|uniref:hypothetical protein n=1 Tax=Bacillus inaquosorum TaxID=483913 RepID=UPI00227F9E9D|nr:hypothetical protein [Bacillus inaquosorum]MCY9014528.1 hypothetical protein [Bacillus inaquosorum]MCY9043081.1 hypothetical protein [Bacillus inaquosorum]MCY9105344.1 hypothetical protein [Bacillus inaquosorum]MCY9123095.1 hypothetical protein [Bacillus inaquosorum]
MTTTITILVSVVVPIITALISFFASRYQAKNELEKAREQQKAELKSLREQHELEIGKIKTELKEQAELYAANKQTDLQFDLMSKIFSGEMSEFTQLEKTFKELERLDKVFNQDATNNK